MMNTHKTANMYFIPEVLHVAYIVSWVTDNKFGRQALITAKILQAGGFRNLLDFTVAEPGSEARSL